MYLHLGNGIIINTNDLIGIFDLDNATVSKRTRDYLNRAQKENKIVVIGNDLPKSFVVCRDKSGKDKVYLSVLSSATLLQRSALKNSL